MRIDASNTYMFIKGNKNNLITNTPDDIYAKNFTLCIEFTPDIEDIKKGIKENAYYVQGLMSKNGKHTGLFLTTNEQPDGNTLVKVNFEWWAHTDIPEVDKVQSCDVYFQEDVLNSPIRAIVKKEGDDIFINVNGETNKASIKDAIDYSLSYTWIGAAQRLFEDFENIYVGDISKFHLQEGHLEDELIDNLWNNYDKFVNEVALDRSKKIIFTSNFENYTPYKVEDNSYNYNHLIQFSKEWLT